MYVIYFITVIKMEIKIGTLDEQKIASEDGIYKHRFVLSSDSIDRDFEQVLVNGISIKNFLKYPVMYFMHKTYEGIPIGLWEDVAKEKRGDKNYLLATTNYNPDDEDAMEVAKFVDTGYLRMASIGFISLANEKVQAPKEFQEVISRWTNDGMMRVIVKSELTEASIVGIGSNPDALKEKFTKGLLTGITDLDMKWYKDKTFDPQREFIFLNHKLLTNKTQTNLFGEEVEVNEKKTTKILSVEEKQGAVLSKKNKAMLQTAMENIKVVLDSSEPEPEPVNYMNNLEVENIKVYNETELCELLN